MSAIIFPPAYRTIYFTDWRTWYRLPFPYLVFDYCNTRGSAYLTVGFCNENPTAKTKVFFPPLPNIYSVCLKQSYTSDSGMTRAAYDEPDTYVLQYACLAYAYKDNITVHNVNDGISYFWQSGFAFQDGDNWLGLANIRQINFLGPWQELEYRSSDRQIRAWSKLNLEQITTIDWLDSRLNFEQFEAALPWYEKTARYH
jgi:hypothetical protein